MREAGEAMGDSRSRNSMAGGREGGREGRRLRATATWPRRAGSARERGGEEGVRWGTERKEVKIGGVGWIRLAGEIRTRE